MAEAQVGVTCPPFHPWCRSITIPVVAGLEIQHRTARDPSTGKTISVPGEMTYGEWKKGVEASGNADGVGGILGEEAGANPNHIKVNPGQQDKHILGTNNYKQSLSNGIKRSILTEDAQQLLDEFAATGQKLRENKERIDCKRIIGQYYSREKNQYQDTSKAIIHYDSKGRAHIVPARPEGDNHE